VGTVGVSTDGHGRAGDGWQAGTCATGTSVRAWESRTRPDRTTVTGLGPCLPLLVLAGPGDPA
jgi:hypothetical protein